jgi:hypothetical protein
MARITVLLAAVSLSLACYDKDPCDSDLCVAFFGGFGFFGPHFKFFFQNLTLSISLCAMRSGLRL